ncbi:A-kinase anchor protein 12 [Scomber scombrus]|uniref:A-kinase anchor protein 12 n=1 Tax=Scomber scombrus TaxID=13677 RepID=UPI002DDACC00|nr:A-kinase anchor protein 12 [Scomber scombrus]
MGDTQSAQREGKKDAAAEEESGVDDAQPEQHIEEKPLKNNGQISEINEKADDSIAEVNGYCGDEFAAEAAPCQNEDVSETEKSLKETETPSENVNIIENESPNDADANEEVTMEMTDMEAKQNDINEGFRKFFSNIGLKLTVKRGSGEKSDIATDVPVESNTEESTGDVEDIATEAKSESDELNTDMNIAQETNDNDSTCPTLTYVTSNDVLEDAEEKATEAKEEASSDIADTATSSPESEDEKTNQDATPEEPHTTSSLSPDQDVVVSPIKRFFTTGIFSGLRKKKKTAEDETTEKELVDMGKKEAVDATEDKKEISLGVEAAAVETENKENLPAASAQPEIGENELEEKLPPADSSTVIVSEPEILSSQEKDKVQASPLKRLLSGSSLKKLSKKQRSRTSSDAKLSDSGEHVSDHVLSSTESAEHQKEESLVQPCAEAAGEEDGAWASFKKLVTPKKRMKKSSLSSEDTPIPGSEEPKPSEGEQISDRSTEESKKRKDSSVSWEAVLCGSGRRRSRKTSDSEDETPQSENDDAKQGAESPLESSNEADEILASSPKQAGSPSEGDGGSTWKSFKKRITPKRKGKNEEESKDNIHSDGEVAQDESSYRKKRKSAEKQDQVSSDEADKDVASGDEDSETPAVVPLSEFDTVETDVVIQSQADVESHVPKEADNEPKQDLIDEMAEPVLPCDDLQTEGKKVQDNDDALENQAPTTSATNEEEDDDLKSISKHQQLSDIPEEGAITETMGTPASVTEEAARDDTIAEDLIEITSEAITAPEPLDTTLADETEMISAVSQLSESSKTSGNTTPVPAEYDVKETDTLLHQVVETITTTSNGNVVPVCSDEMSAERIVGSVLHQVLETFETEEPKLLEIHRKSSASAINTGLNVKELEAVNNFAATAQTECISEITEAVSTEIVSEVPTEEFDKADIDVDEVHEVHISQPELIVGANETEIELKMKSQEAESAATEVEETKDEAIEQELQLETKDENVQSITNQAEAEVDSAVVLEELQALPTLKEDTIDLEEGRDQTLENEVTSEDITTVETATEETKEETAPLTGVSVEPIDLSKAEHEEPVEVEAVDASKFDSEDGIVESLIKEEKSEDISAEETATEEIKEETAPLTGVSVEPVDLSKAEHEEPVEVEAVDASKFDSEDGSVESLIKKEKSEDISAEETVTEEPKEATEASVESEVVQVEAAKTEHDQEQELLPCDVKDTMTETETGAEAPTSEQEVTESVEEGSAQELEEQTLLAEEIPKPETEDVIASEEIVNEDVAKLDQSLEINQEQQTQDTTDDVPRDVQVEEEDQTPEAVDELQTITAVHVSAVNEETSTAQVVEKTVNSEEPPLLCGDIPAVTEEVKHEVLISEVQESVEGEKEGKLQGAEMKTVDVEHAALVEVSTCDVSDVSAATPDVLIEQKLGIDEPLLETVANEQEFKDQIETATPLMKDDEAEIAQEGSMVVMMHVPLVELEDNHSIQVEVVDVHIKSADTIVDTVLEVVVTEDKEIIDLCHETVKKVDNLSAISEIEEELINEEIKVTIQEVIQHVKEKLPETLPESVDVHSNVQNEDVNVEQEVIKQPNDAIVESVLSEVDDQKEMEGSTEKSSERQEEGLVITGDTSAITSDQQVSEDIMQTPDIPGGSDVSIQSHKEDLEETKAELQKSEVAVTAEDAKCSSEDLFIKTVNEDTIEGPQIAQRQIATPSNTGLVVPQNTGIISSIGNVESPSTLSLEFKLNIQFGQTKAPVSPPPTTEKAEPVKQTDVSEVGVQAVEEVEPIRQTNPVENHKQTELTETATQATEITRTAETLHLAEITNPPVLLDVGIQAMEKVEPVEETKSTESVIPNLQVSETTETIRKTEEVCDQEVTEEEPVKQIEEESEQDVWMDAEENIEEETEVSPLEESPEREKDGDQEEKLELEHEFETPPSSNTEAEESQQEVQKTEGTCEVESEGEDFSVALEDPETATVSDAKMEWD